MNPSLMGYEAEVLDGLDAPARRQVADELAALELAVASDPALRSALTDTSIAPGPRRAVVAAKSLLPRQALGPGGARRRLRGVLLTGTGRPRLDHRGCARAPRRAVDGAG